MESILEAINEWIKEILIGAINGNLSTMFGDVNEKVGTIAAEVGKTPQGWNANIFNMIQNLSENVIVPIAGLVITYVLCYGAYQHGNGKKQYARHSEHSCSLSGYSKPLLPFSW